MFLSNAGVISVMPRQHFDKMITINPVDPAVRGTRVPAFAMDALRHAATPMRARRSINWEAKVAIASARGTSTQPSARPDWVNDGPARARAVVEASARKALAKRAMSTQVLNAAWKWMPASKPRRAP